MGNKTITQLTRNLLLGSSSALLFLFLATASSQTAQARSIYLNGIDISNAQGQDIENVNIHINENGDIFIIAPHYQVNEEETYMPLSKLQSRSSLHGKKFSRPGTMPQHKKPRELPSHVDPTRMRTPDKQLPAVELQPASDLQGKTTSKPEAKIATKLPADKKVAK